MAGADVTGGVDAAGVDAAAVDVTGVEVVGADVAATVVVAEVAVVPVVVVIVLSSGPVIIIPSLNDVRGIPCFVINMDGCRTNGITLVIVL